MRKYFVIDKLYELSSSSYRMTMSDYETILDLNTILKLTKLKFIDFLTLMALAGKFN